MKRNLSHTIGERSGLVLDMIRYKTNSICDCALNAQYEELIWYSFDVRGGNSIGDEISINLGIPITIFCR